MCCIAPFALLCSAQTTKQIDECKNALAKNPDPDTPPSVCSLSLVQLAPDERVVSVSLTGVETLTKGIFKEHRWPPKLESALLLAEAKRLCRDVQQKSKENPDVAAPFLESLKGNWVEQRDYYCSYHPGDVYSDLADQEQLCPEAAGHSANSVATASLQPFSPFKVPPSSQGTSTCQKAITFAAVEHSGLAYRLPNISTKWLDKAQKKYPAVCFTQYGAHSGQRNYLVVLSTSSSAYSGLQPVFHRNTTVNPISGSGTVTGNTGATWDFTYQGTITTTTTLQTDVSYTDTTRSFYANAYSESGSLVGTSERSASSRQGGDASNALGYNLTSALLSIHLKEHLLEDIVKKVSVHQ
jgi:hypothetical protein